MKKIALVVLAVMGVASSSGRTQSPGRGAAQPPFDGNVANVAWGGRVESVTGEKQTAYARTMLVDSFPGKRDYGTADIPGPVEVVISFFKRDTARIGAVHITTLSSMHGMRDVEVWASPASAADGFTKVAETSVPLEPSPSKRPETTLTFPPVDARFVKIRFTTHHTTGQAFRIMQIRVMEAGGAGYVPIVTRHPEIADPVFIAEGAAAAAAQAPPAAGCVPAVEPPMQPGNGETRNVLVVVKDTILGADARFVPLGLKTGKWSKTLTTVSPELAILDRISAEPIIARYAQPWMLADYDTVDFEQMCDFKNFEPRFLQALTAWVAAGHKLIIHDSDKCGSSKMDYGWLPYRIVTNVPGAMGAPGSVLRITENSWMMHTLRTRAGFVDTAAWVALPPPANELGDSNAVTEWQPGWCGQMAVKNANGVFGFVQAYARYGKGLIIWDGLDTDMNGTKQHDIVRARQLAQGWNPDNLPCSVKIGSFAVTTEPRLVTRGVQAGHIYTYPLAVLPNMGYKGTVTLSATPVPAAPGFTAAFKPATMEIAGEQQSELTIAVPPGMTTPMAIEVKGTAADGKTHSLCLRLGPPTSGQLQVLSDLAPPSNLRKNLELILDASGSMKTLMGKRSRWDTALSTMQGVLADLPDDFNVGLRIYGHREPSTSPKTCTDSELVVPIRKLNRAGIYAAANRFKPKGETPLVYSALQTPADLKPVGGGTVILITDGEESCKGDPLKAAAELKASGMDVRLNIVGFALANPKTRAELAGFAQATGGLFYAAKDGAALSDALIAATTAKFPYTVYDAAGKVVLVSEAGGGSDDVAPGEYRVVVRAGTREIVAPRVKVTLGQQTTVKIVLKGDQLALE